MAAALKSIQLIQLPRGVIDALAAGDLDGANRQAPLELTEHFSRDRQPLWRIRSAQLQEHPGDAVWITRAVYDPELRRAVGLAGFHGPPDDAGMVEVGYSVDPAYRRQGYARAALEALLAVAAQEPSIHIVRATISPDNEASRRLVEQYGFVANGEQWDDEDGLEIIYEVDTGGSAGSGG
ncbi:GNAT family N-acetyltransferase [Arthrobacter zhangbolii]|uniref:GNAT family N-acetyltransferase n=1 Tax=Arthrobacter zhangbolii TaxID=2886936 RepID=A0A9X1SB09_9MICC|nr:GNAT family N-acetyltransferase [Arthrobacter zhangbolii]MCC3272324.1 GNAT family N-acetyltransferase [Arthrobacter zhangbolii]UON91813.1 GNAT family N-acetyltransferase [Arthrobacter zhangbolii]